MGKKQMLIESLFLASLVTSGSLSATTAQNGAVPAKVKQENSNVEKVIHGDCYGINACKGQSDCHTASTSCAGTNACKGQGIKKMTNVECKKLKGTFK